MKRIIFGAAIAVLGTAAQAQGLNITENDFYFGAGVSHNEYEVRHWEDDAIGFQIFGGVDLAKIDQLTLGVEVGYMDAGEAEDWGWKSDAEGIWANGVASYAIGPVVDLIGRVGVDFGDDDGFMAGAGAGFNIGPRMQIRAEYVVRDHIDSLQANFVYHL